MVDTEQSKPLYRSINIKKWSDFAHIIGVEKADLFIASGRPPHFWRGQANAEWILEPSILRTLRRRKVSVEKAIAIEKAAKKGFEKSAHLYLPAHLLEQDQSILDWWSLMRHYGVPSRTLDWSASPYVGLYFAVDKEPDHDGAVWLFAPTLLLSKQIEHYDSNVKIGSGEIIDSKRHDDLFLNPKPKPIIHCMSRTILTDRMFAQQSTFTVCENLLTDHTVAIGKMVTLNKLIIPKERKPELLAKLHVMNITAASLFPGVDGVGRYLTEVAHIQAYESVLP